MFYWKNLDLYPFSVSLTVRDELFVFVWVAAWFGLIPWCVMVSVYVCVVYTCLNMHTKGSSLVWMPLVTCNATTPFWQHPTITRNTGVFPNHITCVSGRKPKNVIKCHKLNPQKCLQKVYLIMTEIICKCNILSRYTYKDV